MDTDLLNELVIIDRERKRLKGELDALNSTRADIQEAVLTQWELEGITQARVDGATIFVSSQKWAKAKDGDRKAVVAVLELLGMDEMVSFNSQSLSGYFRELERDEIPPPPELIAVCEFSENFAVKTKL